MNAVQSAVTHLSEFRVVQSWQIRLARELLAAAPCCLDDFTINFKDGKHTEDDILAPEALAFLNSVFQHVPLTNIASESRFASMHTHMSSNRGHPTSRQSLASDHVLGEAKMVHDATIAP